MEHIRNYHSSSLKGILIGNPKISKHNFDSIVMRYLKLVKPSLYYKVLNDYPVERRDGGLHQYWMDSRLDPISRGKILEVFIVGLRALDPLDDISAQTLSDIDWELDRYFREDYLNIFFKNTYFGEIRKARFRQIRTRKRSEVLALKEKIIKKRIHKNIKTWEHSKRYKLKRVRDFQRLKFIKDFSILNPIAKLKLILNDEMDFPLISIPDEALFKANLILRSEIKKTFSLNETRILSMKFLCKKKRHRGVNWSSILKAF